MCERREKRYREKALCKPEQVKRRETGVRWMNLGSGGLHRERRRECVRSEDVAALLLKKEAADLSTSSGKVRKEKN